MKYKNLVIENLPEETEKKRRLEELENILLKTNNLTSAVAGGSGVISMLSGVLLVYCDAHSITKGAVIFLVLMAASIMMLIFSLTKLYDICSRRWGFIDDEYSNCNRCLEVYQVLHDMMRIPEEEVTDFRYDRKKGLFYQKYIHDNERKTVQYRLPLTEKDVVEGDYYIYDFATETLAIPDSLKLID